MLLMCIRGPLAVLSGQFDTRLVAGRTRDAAVACQQGCIQCFCEGNIRRVIGREVVPQFPYAG